MSLSEIQSAIRDLPTMPPNEQTEGVLDLLFSCEVLSRHERHLYSELLLELVIRFALNETDVPKIYKQKINQWIQDNWDNDSRELAHTLITLLFHTDLGDGESFLMEKLKTCKKALVRTEIKEAIKDLQMDHSGFVGG